MATTSSPAVGVGGFTDLRWSEMFQADNGIINDYDGTTVALTRVNTGNIARYSFGYVRVDGYVLKILDPTDLVVPTAAGTYYTWVSYDPALNVAAAGGGASGDGPCRLGVSLGLPSTAGSKRYVYLDQIVRTAGQDLTAAVTTSLRVWCGPSLQIEKLPAGASGGEWFVVEPNHAATMGATLHVRDINMTFHRAMDGLNLIWRAESGVETTFPAPSSLVAFDSAAMMSRSGGRVFLRGTLKRSSGANLSNGNEVTLGTLPAGWRPSSVRRFLCYGNGVGTNQVLAPVKIGSNGAVIMYDPPATVTWIDLSQINFQIGA